MGSAAEEAYATKSAEAAFSNYCNAQSELAAARPRSDRALALAQKRDELWQAYLSAGGQRIAWHFPPKDPRQEQGRSPDGIRLPIRLHEHSTWVHITRFWIGMSPRQSDQWDKDDARALRVWQQNNGLPPGDDIDRVTWSALLELAYEVASAPIAQKPRDVATGFQGSKVGAVPTVLTLERAQPWMLALDNAPHLTFANHWNLALMAVLAYSDAAQIDKQVTSLNERQYRGRVQLNFVMPESYKQRFKNVADHRSSLPLTYGEKNRVRPFVRPATRPYQTKFLEKKETNTQAFVAWNDVHVIIAARGTETDPNQGMWADLNSDAMANPTPWPHGRGGQVHTGFFRAFESIRDEIVKALEPVLANHPTKQIFVCGHSLGGAIATLVSCFLRKSKPQNPVQLYTYGQPRVGNVEFARAFWQRDAGFSYYRTANYLDLVTWVPAIWTVPEAKQFAELAKLGLRMYSGALIGLAANPQTGEIPADFQVAMIEEERKKSKAIDDYMKANLNTAEDYRHFGVLLPCGTDLETGPFLEQVSQVGGRKIEPQKVPRAQGLYNLEVFSTVWHAVNHMMSEGYLPHLASYYERNLDAYLMGKPRVPLATPELPRVEAQLVWRMLKRERHNWVPPESAGGIIERMIDDWWESEQ